LIDAIQRGDAITFREGGVIEHRIDEVIDLSLKGHHRLPDVNQFRRTVADCMHAEQLTGLIVKEQLQHADLITDDLAAGDFAVAGDADGIGDSVFGQVVFVAADPRDLRRNG